MTDYNEKWWLNWTYQYANTDIFGPLAGGHTVQEGIYATLGKWLPAYLAEFNRNLGGEVLQLPRTYRLKPDWETLPRDMGVAQVLVISNGTTGRPERHQHQTRSTWETKVMVFLAGTKDWQETQAISLAYGAAVRACLAQHPGLEGIAETTLWTGERYTEKEHVSARIIGLMTVDFEVTIGNTLDVFGGPPSPEYTAEGSLSAPSILPYPDAPIVDEVNINVNNTDDPLGPTGPELKRKYVTWDGAVKYDGEL